jgi:hypothetical protein
MNDCKEITDAEKAEYAERALLIRNYSDSELINRYRSYCIRYGEKRYSADYAEARILERRIEELQYELKDRLFIRIRQATHAT